MRHATRYVCISALLFLMSLTLTRPANAQSQATTGLIRGVVTNNAGAPLPGVSVVLRNGQTNITRTATTNERGVFVAALLPVGTYDVVARTPGMTEARQNGVVVSLGGTVDLDLRLGAVQLTAIQVTAERPVVETDRVESSTSLDQAAVAGIPNNGRNFIRLALLTPNVAVVQGPDGDEITVSGQRGIYNNVSVDGADFNNPFFGEQRGGQRPPFTFNLDAVQEMVVVSEGASAEFGRSGGGFINILTKSGTNQLHGSAHYFGQASGLSSSLNGLNPDFAQHQFGFTLGGPLVRDRAFFFIAYDQQLFHQTKQTSIGRVDPLLKAWSDTAFGGALAGDWGPIRRTSDGQALLVKLDWHLSPSHSLSVKYNYANSRQENGTFDVDTWARSANAVERDFSNAVNGSLVSLLSPTMTNELRVQYSREDRPRPYGGPTIPNTSGALFGTSGRPIPDTGADFGNGYRWGMPFFIPIQDHDTRIQVVDNLSVVRGNHLWKAGFEVNRTATTQTFIGFANQRFIFSSVPGFLNYASQGPKYVECSNNTSNNTGACPAGTTITGPLLLFLQFAPVQAGQTVADAGTQTINQTDLALFLQDTWKPQRNLTVNYGLRWEAQIEPDPITSPATVFFQPFIGQTINGHAFPSDGKIPSDYTMFQPRLGIAWDVHGNGMDVLRASAGMYSPRTPGLDFASTRTSNGSVGQTIFRASFFNGFGVTPPVYGGALPTPAAGVPQSPGVFVTDKNFKNPRVLAINAAWEHALSRTFAVSLSYSFAHTTNLNRFIDRNDAVFGSPFAHFGGVPANNGIGSLTVLESTAKSQYHGFTLGMHGNLSRRVAMQVNYTLSFDKSDDDNERDPFSFRYARADSLQAEYNWSDRDQRHRLNAWLLVELPWHIAFNSSLRVSSAQPTSEKCGASNVGTGVVAGSPQDRICPNGHILLRNTIRKDNAFMQWDIRLSRAFPVGGGHRFEVVADLYNLTNRLNNLNPSAPSLLFNFDGTIRSGIGDSRRFQLGARWEF